MGKTFQLIRFNLFLLNSRQRAQRYTQMCFAYVIIFLYFCSFRRFWDGLKLHINAKKIFLSELGERCKEEDGSE